MTMTEEHTHTPECVELLTSKRFTTFSTTMQALGEEGRTVIYACPHPAHDIPKQIWGARP